MVIRNKYKQHYQAASLVFIAMLFIQLMSQLHLHLRHVDTQTSDHHEHVIDYHVLGEHHASDHMLDRNTDVLVKKTADRDPGLVLGICLTVLLPWLAAVLNRQWQVPRSISIHHVYFGLAPPLRAPPF
jgi:hypothetical protein